MLPRIIALLFASGESLSIKEIAELLGTNKESVVVVLPDLKKYLEEGGLSLVEHDDTWQIVTSKEMSELVESLLKKDLEGDLTPATLQVLTIVAYLGRVSKQDISYIRGVQSAQSIRTLSVRGLIERIGDDCVLTAEALKYLGVTKNEELPEYETLSKDLTEKLLQSKKE